MLGFEGTLADILLSANNSIDLHSECSVYCRHMVKNLAVRVWIG